MVGRIERRPLSSVWKREVDLTHWLEDNIDFLDDAIGIGLTDARREESTGSFFCDLVAEDASGGHVVIENEFGSSDHDHLGKLMTYFASLGAQVGIWVVENARSEHVSAVEWLNQSGLGSFYLVKAEVITIGDSEPAPVFTVITGPSAHAEDTGNQKRELAERHKERFDFWSQVLKMASTRTKLHANVKPSTETWLGTGAGKSGLQYTYVVQQHQSGVELYIDGGAGSEGWNASTYSFFLARRTDVEQAFGGPLLWDEKEGRRGRRIRANFEGGYRDPGQREEIIDRMVEAMIRLETALKPLIAQLPG